MIRWDLWQFRNKVLHSPKGPLAVAQHHTLNYRIGEEFTLGTDGIDVTRYHLFKGDNTEENLQAGAILDKQKWLETVSLARATYEAPEAAVTQECSLRRSMNNYLVPDGSRTFVSTPVHDYPTIAHNVRITTKELRDTLAEWMNIPATTPTVLPIPENIPLGPPRHQRDLFSWIAS